MDISSCLVSVTFLLIFIDYYDLKRKGFHMFQKLEKGKVKGAGQGDWYSLYISFDETSVWFMGYV